MHNIYVTFFYFVCVSSLFYIRNRPKRTGYIRDRPINRRGNRFFERLPQYYSMSASTADIICFTKLRAKCIALRWNLTSRNLSTSASFPDIFAVQWVKTPSTINMAATVGPKPNPRELSCSGIQQRVDFRRGTSRRDVC